MSTGSGALRIPGPAVSKTRAAIGAVVLAGIVTAAAMWAAFVRDGSDTTEPVGSRPQVTQVGQAGPGGGFEGAVRERIEFTRGKQLGVGPGYAASGTAGESSGAVEEPIVVGGEVCQVCWKYR